MYLAQINPGEPEKQFIRAHKSKAQKNAVAIDIEKYAFEMWGVNLMGIDGISEGFLLKLVGEPGHDFTLKFNSFKEFCCRYNVTPNNKISGGKLLSSKIPKRKNPVGLILRQAANALNAGKKPLGFYFRRIKSKNGHKAAVVATANKLGRIIYVMVKNKTEYDPTKAKCTESDILKRKLIAAQKALNNINRLINDVA